ncbi:MAG: hypothetical protein DHS80DRAFT_30097 [Piptocephalis tieghemiana]|nr:MAG: hypothetical protein DHS80DRAFT_30097 [Piptocephalis tieghemiana]
MTKSYPTMEGLLILKENSMVWIMVDEMTFETRYIMRPLGPGDEGPLVLVDAATGKAIWDLSGPLVQGQSGTEEGRGGEWVDILSLPETTSRVCIRLYRTSEEGFRWEMGWGPGQVLRWKKPAFSAHLRCVDARDPAELLAAYEPVVDENLPEYLPIKGVPLGWIRSVRSTHSVPEPLADDSGFIAASLVLLSISRNDRV